MGTVAECYQSHDLPVSPDFKTRLRAEPVILPASIVRRIDNDRDGAFRACRSRCSAGTIPVDIAVRMRRSRQSSIWQVRCSQ